MKNINIILVAVLSIMLAACGGGGSSDSVNETPLGYSANDVVTYMRDISLPVLDSYYEQVSGDRIFLVKNDMASIVPQVPGSLVQVRSKLTGNLLYEVMTQVKHRNVFGLNNNILHVVDNGVLKLKDVTSNMSMSDLGQLDIQAMDTQIQCMKQIASSLYVIGNNKHWIIDVSQPSSPSVLMEAVVVDAGAVNFGHSNDALCSLSGNTLMVREGNGIGFFDISVPSQISRTGVFPTSSTVYAASSGNLYVASGNLVEVYTSSSTLVGQVSVPHNTILSMSVGNGVLVVGGNGLSSDYAATWMMYDVTTPSAPRLLDYGCSGGGRNDWTLTDGFNIWQYTDMLYDKTVVYSIDRTNIGVTQSSPIVNITASEIDSWLLSVGGQGVGTSIVHEDGYVPGSNIDIGRVITTRVAYPGTSIPNDIGFGFDFTYSLNLGNSPISSVLYLDTDNSASTGMYINGVGADVRISDTGVAGLTSGFWRWNSVTHAWSEDLNGSGSAKNVSLVSGGAHFFIIVYGTTSLLGQSMRGVIAFEELSIDGTQALLRYDSTSSFTIGAL